MSSGWYPSSVISETSLRARSACPCIANPDVMAFQEAKLLQLMLLNTCSATSMDPHFAYISIVYALQIPINIGMNPLAKVQSTKASTSWKNSQEGNIGRLHI
ncbi:hypothetical protein Ahy_A01g000442 isoform C [Arachis hypogaea]|uniref:Uncharacterized protein n=1 Tax=Arachis hypogaea TaxID=3818 RepID=A0A445EKD4_ARAHY|nr:hypothetical protein Ahy_A01g000442 isoform C [Arachis hypogaea]